MAKNYIAKLLGADTTYGLKREFLGFEVPQGRTFNAIQLANGFDVGVSEFLVSCKVENGFYEIGEGYNNKYKTLVKFENGVATATTKNEILAAF